MSLWVYRPCFRTPNPDPETTNAVTWWLLKRNGFLGKIFEGIAVELFRARVLSSQDPAPQTTRRGRPLCHENLPNQNLPSPLGLGGGGGDIDPLNKVPV